MGDVIWMWLWTMAVKNYNAIEELKREDGTEPSSYLIEERVIVKPPHSYVYGRATPPASFEGR